MIASPRPLERIDETRNHSRRAAVHLSGTLEGADFGRHPARRHDLRVGISAVRSGHRRDRRRADRAPDRAGAGADEALPRDGGSSLENVLKCNVYCTSVEKFAAVNAIYARYFPKDPPARIFVNVPAWPGHFDIEIDCIAAVL